MMLVPPPHLNAALGRRAAPDIGFAHGSVWQELRHLLNWSGSPPGPPLAYAAAVLIPQWRSGYWSVDIMIRRLLCLYPFPIP